MNDSRGLTCVIKNYVISYDLTSPAGPILHKRISWELRPAIVEASLEKVLWFLMKILYVSRVTNDTKTSILVFSAEFLIKLFDIERCTDLREHAIFMSLSAFHY